MADPCCQYLRLFLNHRFPINVKAMHSATSQNHLRSLLGIKQSSDIKNGFPVTFRLEFIIMFFAEVLFAPPRSQTTCFSTCSKPCTISPAAYCKLSNFWLFACGKTTRPKGGESCQCLWNAFVKCSSLTIKLKIEERRQGIKGGRGNSEWAPYLVAHSPVL